MDDIEMELDLGDPMPHDQDDLVLDTEGIGGTAADTSTSGDPQAEPQPSKVHLRGLDELAQGDVQAYMAEHFAEERPQVEWIDDTSANLVFSSATAASAALIALTNTLPTDPASPAAVPTPNPLQLRAAKPLSTKPAVLLHVRQATGGDRKQARAADASRFYLMHPEHDPRERRRHERRPSRGSRRRRRDSRGRSDTPPAKFDASMYDDDEAALAQRTGGRPRSRSRSPSVGRRDRRDSYRPRGRSRSPARGRDGNARRELFPDGAPGAAARNAGKELFGDSAGKNRDAARTRKKELFPGRVAAAADLLGRSLAVPLVDGAADGDDRGFALRSDGMAAQGRGLSIKGAGGFSIRGAADADRAAATDAKVKELFPAKAGNRGKELFDPRRERRTAETFY